MRTTSMMKGVMVNTNCNLTESRSMREKSLERSMRDYLDLGNGGENTQTQCEWCYSRAEVPE